MSKEEYGALSSTMEQQAKLPLYGATESQLQELRDAQQKALEALEGRYAQPNWFKVAAGFAKPQLGGFLASLGSASEALGENVEQQRAQQLPIAQMRAQLAQTNLLLGTKAEAAQMAKDWQRDHPNEPIPPSLMERIAGRDRDLADRLGMGVKQNLEQRTLSQKEQEQQIQLLSTARANLQGLAERSLISPAEYKKRAMEIDRQLLELQRIGPFGNPTRTIPGSANLTPDTRDSQSEAPAVTPASATNASRATSASSAAAAPSIASSSMPSATPERKEKPEGLLPQVHPIPSIDTSAMSPLEQEKQKALLNASTARATDDEKVNQAKYNSLMTFSSAMGNYSDVERARKTIQSIYSKDPQAAQQIVDAVREGGPLAAAVASGFAFHAGSISANISLPVNEYKIAGLDPSKRTDYDALLGAFATLASAGMHSEGITPQTYHPAQFQQSMAKYAGIGQTAKNAYHTAMQSSLNFREQHELAKLLRQEFKRTHPQSIARYTDAFHSPKVDELHNIFNAQRESLLNQFQGGER